MQFSESMKKLGKRFFNEDESEFHEYRVSFVVKGKTVAQHLDVTASTIEDAMKSFNEKVADEFPRDKVTKITNITRDGKMVSKAILDKANGSLLDECDGGAAAGDAGGAAPAGDAGIADAGDVAAEMSGTSTADVLGKCEPGKGYMGKDNFYIPARAKVPLHRWEAANGGSKRKKKGKYPYEKGAKVVVSMFEDEMMDESGLEIAKIYYKGWQEPTIVDGVNDLYDVLQIHEDWANTADPEGDIPEILKITVGSKTYYGRDIEAARREIEDEECEKEYNRSHMNEDDKMLNEFEDRYSSYEYLSGKDWDEVVDAANERARRSGKPPKLPEYERWEAAQLPPPDEQTHGALSGCTIDEDSFAKKQYLKEFFIHGIYKDGEMFELGPMKRKVAAEYLNLHSLTVNKRAFQ